MKPRIIIPIVALLLISPLLIGILNPLIHGRLPLCALVFTDACRHYHLGQIRTETHVSVVDASSLAALHAIAEKGNAGAMWELGLRYEYDDGKGEKQDYAEAYFWLRLAQISGDKYADEDILSITEGRELTPEQETALEKRVTNWLKDHHAPAAGPSAAHP